MNNSLLKYILINGLLVFLFACAEWEPQPFEQSPTHISDEEKPAPKEIPELVQAAPVLPEPEPPVELEKYTVVVNEVPVKELLFALARDAQINVDIDPGVEGVVTINAVDQTLPQILDRITRQTNIRYEFNDNNLLIQPDDPYFRIYTIDYVNIARETSGTVAVATQIDTTGSTSGESGGSSGGENNSLTRVNTISNHSLWQTLTQNIAAIIGDEIEEGSTSSAIIKSTESLVVNPESGIINVKATAVQHEEIQQFIDSVMVSARRQVLIEATVVEVILSDKYQAGIDWSFLNNAAGIDLISTTLTGIPVGTLSSLILNYEDTEIAGEDSLNITVTLLDEFGDTRVLSSPQLMVLNNHTALLKVVENFVYFEVTQEVVPGDLNTDAATATTTTAQTVPVGFVMAITPQISKNDSVTLNIRPTISNVIDTVPDPHPDLTIPNDIPVIRVREMESILSMNDRQIAVLGGLMQDEVILEDNSIPGFSQLPGVGKAFQTKGKEFVKTELVIFLRPIIVRNPSIDGDLDIYKPYLPVSNVSKSQGVDNP